MKLKFYKSLIIGLTAINMSFSAAQIEAPKSLWFPATLTFDGPTVDESETTFRNYRLNVTFSKGSKSFKIPGYFAADGNASETSASSGNKWRVKFTPDESGSWNYRVSFRTGTNIAISFDSTAGTPVAGVDGESGVFAVGVYNAAAPGLYSKGLFKYVGEHYGQFVGNGEWHVKTGPGSPEDFFGYYEFDGTKDYEIRGTQTQKSDSYLQKINGEGLHHYSSHVKDWKEGDPSWKNGKGKGIIGALNYLASIGVNALYMIIMTNTDDSDNTWPWIGRSDFLQYDVSKLEQWDIVFKHMDSIGIAPNLYLSEADNTKDMDNGNMTLQYPIYYREMVARFGHHLGMRYNIGEEPTMSSEQIRAAAELIAKLDEYNHPVGVHSSHKRVDQLADYTFMLGKNYFDGAWIQLHPTENVDHTDIYYWRDESAKTNHKWIVANDESFGTDGTQLDQVQTYYWQTVMAGGEGFFQYTGYNIDSIGDITLENFRMLENTQKIMAHGKNLFMIPGINALLPQMKSEDGLVENAGSNDPPFCYAKKGDLYLVYRSSSTNQKTVDLTGATGTFRVKWYDPRTGGSLQNGSVTTVNGGAKVSLGDAPKDNTKPWAIIVSKADITSGSVNSKSKNATQSKVIGIGSQGIQFYLTNPGAYRIRLHNFSGKLLKSGSGNGTAGFNQIDLGYKPILGQTIFVEMESHENHIIKQFTQIR